MLQRLQQVVGWAPSSIRVNFQVSASVGHGETLVVLGTLPALGGSIDLFSKEDSFTGIPSDGLVLVTTPELFPIWYNPNPLEVKCGTTFTYRYAIWRGGKFHRYENIAPREATCVKGQRELSLQDELDVVTSTENVEPHENHLSATVIPRLSSGMAFTSRYSSGTMEDGVQRRLMGNAISSPIHLAATIPEDEEVRGDDEQKSDNGSDPPQLDLDGMKLLSMSPEERVLSADSQRFKRPRSTLEDGGAFNNVSIDSTDGVIIVAYYLPVKASKVMLDNGRAQWTIQWEEDDLLCPTSRRILQERQSSVGGVKSFITDTTRLTWVGQVNVVGDTAISVEDEAELIQALTPFHCVPIFLRGIRKDFEQYSRGTLWPVFHNVVGVYGKLPTRWWDPTHQKNMWRAYTVANRMFVNKVIECYNDGDLVWVHGVDLLLAPSFLARRLPCANIGLFLHAPFPSSEIFRTLSVREELLRGMLSADHIGFHLYEYARHFLTSCRRILGLKNSLQSGGYLGVEYNGRTVSITISHIGIAPEVLNYHFGKRSVQSQVAELTQKFKSAGEVVIVSCDAIEKLQGIPLKLRAIERFLSKSPQYASKIHLIQIGVKSLHFADDSTFRDDIIGMVNNINSTYQGGGNQPIITFIEQEDTNLAYRLPYWLLGDIMLVTSIRDAVNLDPFEFVYAQELAKKNGLVILSEFSGSSRVLTGCLGINPWKINEIVDAIDAALQQDPQEKKSRHKKNFEYVEETTQTLWAERVLIDLKRVRRDAKEGDYMGYGLGLGFRMLEFNVGFRELDIDKLTKSYRTSFRRVVLLDFGNTLVAGKENEKYGKGSAVNHGSKETIKQAPGRVTSLLLKLCEDPRNTVFVLSGRDRSEMEVALGNVTGLGLAAEHGYYYRWGDKKAEGWLCTKENFDDSWKDLTHSIMDIYTQRTHGTFVEVKGSALLWQFVDADPEFGQLQAKELQDQLTQVLEHFPVEVLMGENYIEVRPEGVDKGSMVDRIVSTIESSSKHYADFILCIGDDKADESMFSYLEENRPREKLFTVTVGKKPSRAKFFLNDVDSVLELLNSMTKVSTTANRNLSMTDLRHFSTDVASLQMLGISPPNNRPSPVPLNVAKASMSMGSISKATGLTTSASSTTLEQYFSNLDEDDEDVDQGGIFF